MKLKLLVSVALSLGLFSTNVSAVSMYEISNASVSHGLWTNKLHPPGGNYFSIEQGTMTADVGANTAMFAATATNHNGAATATIEFSLSGGSPYTTGQAVKRGGFPDSGINQNAIIQSWRFYEHVVGTIKIEYPGSVTVYDIVIRPGDPVFQQGDYANDKTPDYGASVWLEAFKRNADGSTSPLSTGHWDINVDLTPVPLPAAAWLFGSALLGLISIGRRRKLAVV